MKKGDNQTPHSRYQADNKNNYMKFLAVTEMICQISARINEKNHHPGSTHYNLLSLFQN